MCIVEGLLCSSENMLRMKNCRNYMVSRLHMQTHWFNCSALSCYVRWTFELKKMVHTSLSIKVQLKKL